MQFNQIIYTSDLENVLYNSVDGIKVIHEIFLTQDGSRFKYIESFTCSSVNDGTGVVQVDWSSSWWSIGSYTQNTYGHGYITRV